MLTQSYRREIYYIITAEYFNIVIFVVWHFFYNQQRVPYCVRKNNGRKKFLLVLWGVAKDKPNFFDRKKITINNGKNNKLISFSSLAGEQ